MAMNSTLDFSTSTADLLAQQLDKIVLSNLSAGDPVIMTFTVYDGTGTYERDSWTTTYYADEDGKVTISSLARMWNSYILAESLRQGGFSPSSVLGGIQVTIAYELEDETTGSCTRRLWYQRRKTGKTLANITGSIPAIATVKKTFVGAKEPAVVTVPYQVTVKVTSTYVLNGSVSTRTDSLNYSSSDVFRGLWDVSPSVIAALIPTGGVLKEYTAVPTNVISTLGNGQVRYVLGNYPHGTQLCWLNNYGLWETLLFEGSKVGKLERSAETAFAGDDLSAFNLESMESMTVHTGYVNAAVMEQVRDLSDSPLVFVNDGGTWKQVVVDAVDWEKTVPSNSALTASVTYRMAQNQY